MRLALPMRLCRLLAVLLGAVLLPLFAPTAALAQTNYTLTLSKSGTGTGTVTSSPAGIDCGSTCTYSFASGTTVTLTATPASGSLFQSWSGACTGASATCTVSMTAAKTGYATFAPAQYALTVSKSGGGTGTVTSSPAGIDCGTTCAGNFANGSSVTLTATPDASFVFQGWSGKCTGWSSTCVLTMNAAKTATATFGLPTTTYQYDANGNLTQVTDPVGNVRQTVYDYLDRPYQIKEPHATAVGTTQGQINLAYDGQDRTAAVKDPRNLTTTYTVDGLGNLTSLASPDTGTATLSYDEAGNLKTRLDARGKLASYAYDALNRLVQASYGDQIVSYVWDTCTNGIGRLCQVIDASGSTAFAYDAHGRVLQRSQTLGSLTQVTRYAYNGAGQLTGLTTPSGQTLAYDWADGKLSAIHLNGSPLITAIRYQPFGPVAGWTWGNGQTMSRSFDLAGRWRSISLGTDPQTGSADRRDFAYDAAGRVRSVLAANDASLGQVHGYDGLDRLTATQLGSPVTGSQTLAYDLSGNRTGKTVNGATTSYTTPAASNRLASLAGAEVKSFAYDAAGNTIAAGAVSYGYDNAGRRTSATIGGQTWWYAYDAFGQRVRKTGPMGSVLFAYDAAGHLLGEYDGQGRLIQETVWLGDTPLATLRLPVGSASGPAHPFYVHADHLNTPRRITRPADNKVLWQWLSEPFGDSTPNENPQGLGSFQYNLRFPGQFFDSESGTHYNYFRDYDPNTGRYQESDPVGLEGGINTYSYVNGNPISYIDPEGLKSPQAPGPQPAIRPPSNMPSGPSLKDPIGDLARFISPPNLNWGAPLPGPPRDPTPTCWMDCPKPGQCDSSHSDGQCVPKCTYGPVVGPW